MARRLINFSISVNIISLSPTDGKWTTRLPNQTTITEARCTFTIERDLKPKPGSSILQVYNLAPATRYQLQQQNLLIEILAGYDGDLRRVFSGDVLYSSSTREGADWVTKIQMGDGARAYNYARINRSYPAGATYRTICQDIAAAMGLILPAVSGPDLDLQVPTAVSLHGPAQAELTRFLAPHGMVWSIQAGELVILRSTDTRPGDAIVIDESAGMIGSPAYGNPDHKGTPPTMSVTCLVYPEISPGKIVEVRSRDIHGQFRVEKVKHTGDTWGDDRKTQVECRQVK